MCEYSVQLLRTLIAALGIIPYPIASSHRLEIPTSNSMRTAQKKKEGTREAEGKALFAKACTEELPNRSVLAGHRSYDIL